MFRTRLSRRLLAVAAVVAIIGLGTIGLHHVYTDVMGTDDAGHSCLTCRVVTASVALVGAAVTGIATYQLSSAVSFLPLPVVHAGFVVRPASRGPPAVLAIAFALS